LDWRRKIGIEVMGVDDEVDCNSTRKATRPFPFPFGHHPVRASEHMAATSGIGRLLLSSTLSKRAFKLWILEQLFLYVELQKI
jgi:hypothetical protein